MMCACAVARHVRALYLLLLYYVQCSVYVFCCGCSPIGLQPTYNLHLTMRLPRSCGLSTRSCRLSMRSQRVHAGCQCVHAGCQFSSTSWCGLGPSVRTVLMLTGERLCQNTTSAFCFCLNYISWIAPARQQWSTFC